MRGHLRKRGGSWELRAYAGRDPVTKRQAYVTRTFRGSKREAEEALARLVADTAGGGHAAHDTSLEELLRSWLQHAKTELSPTTARGYSWIIATYILPTLGEVPLERLKTAQLDRFYSTLRERGGKEGAPLSPATVRQVHAILRRALGQALCWGWIASNPAALATPPKVRAAVTDAPSPSEILSLLDAALDHNPELGCFLHLAATSGARRGELCGLQWRDVDFDRRAIVICRNVVEGEAGELVVKDTKTHASRRIAIDETTARDLQGHRERRAEQLSAFGVSATDGSFVFSAPTDPDHPWTPNEVTKAFIRLRNKLHLKHIRLHDLRHFAATRLLAAGIPVRTVSGRLGHSNAATTFGVYAHFVEESDREAASKLESILARKA